MIVIGLLGMDIDRLLSLFTKHPAVRWAMNDNLGSRLSLQNVFHQYGNFSVIHDLNLAVRPGEILVLVGTPGCGKTTILNLLSRHIQPSAGKNNLQLRCDCAIGLVH